MNFQTPAAAARGSVAHAVMVCNRIVSEFCCKVGPAVTYGSACRTPRCSWFVLDSSVFRVVGSQPTRMLGTSPATAFNAVRSLTRARWGPCRLALNVVYIRRCGEYDSPALRRKIGCPKAAAAPISPAGSGLEHTGRFLQQDAPGPRTAQGRLHQHVPNRMADARSRHRERHLHFLLVTTVGGLIWLTLQRQTELSAAIRRVIAAGECRTGSSSG